MKIEIKYESSWRNSFLDGSNDEPLPNTGRKFIGSMTSLKKDGNYISRKVSHNTVMGLLNRLIGDQRKLYQSRQSVEYYFKELEPLVTFEDKPSYVNREMTYIRNISGSTDQNSYTGMIQADSPILTSVCSQQLWGVLGLSFDEVVKFILDENFTITNEISLNPLSLVDRSFLLSKENSIDLTQELHAAIEIIHSQLPEMISDKSATPYVENNGKLKPIRFYAAALYIQFERLNRKMDASTLLTNSGKIAGFSKRGFNGQRDFIKNFATGGEKKIWGNPYIRKEKIKGVGEVTSLMSKAGGTLNINIDVDRSTATNLLEIIENAGVSSFYLGKKGLAYVSNIRI